MFTISLTPHTVCRRDVKRDKEDYQINHAQFLLIKM